MCKYIVFIYTDFIMLNLFSENTLFSVKKHINKRAINGNIQRHVFGGTVHIKNRKHVKQYHDVIAPSRIFDLHLVRYIPYRKTLVISWTAPGDDLDTGKRKTLIDSCTNLIAKVSI